MNTYMVTFTTHTHVPDNYSFAVLEGVGMEGKKRVVGLTKEHALARFYCEMYKPSYGQPPDRDKWLFVVTSIRLTKRG